MQYRVGNSKGWLGGRGVGNWAAERGGSDSYYIIILADLNAGENGGREIVRYVPPRGNGEGRMLLANRHERPGAIGSGKWLPAEIDGLRG